MSKKCFKCGKIKDLSEFYKHPQMSDGHLGKCKTCTKKGVSDNYRDNIEYYREYEIERNQNTERKKNHLKYQKKRRSRNPEKYRARTFVNNAIRDGRLENNLVKSVEIEKMFRHITKIILPHWI